MDLTDILASILNPNGSQQAGAMPAMQAPPSWTRAASSFGMAPQQPSQAPMPVPQMQMPAPSVSTQAMQSQPAPQAQPSPQTAQAGPGGFLTDLLMPKTAAKNRTAAYLQQQGMDAGTANTGTTFYEQGYNSAGLATGLPAAGSILTNSGASDHRYVLAPSVVSHKRLELFSLCFSHSRTSTSGFNCLQSLFAAA